LKTFSDERIVSRSQGLVTIGPYLPRACVEDSHDVFLLIDVVSRCKRGCAALGRSNDYLFCKFCFQVSRYINTRDTGSALLIRYSIA